MKKKVIISIITLLAVLVSSFSLTKAEVINQQTGEVVSNEDVQKFVSNFYNVGYGNALLMYTGQLDEKQQDEYKKLVYKYAKEGQLETGMYKKLRDYYFMLKGIVLPLEPTNNTNVRNGLAEGKYVKFPVGASYINDTTYLKDGIVYQVNVSRDSKGKITEQKTSELYKDTSGNTQTITQPSSTPTPTDKVKEGEISGTPSGDGTGKTETQEGKVTYDYYSDVLSTKIKNGEADLSEIKSTNTSTNPFVYQLYRNQRQLYIENKIRNGENLSSTEQSDYETIRSERSSESLQPSIEGVDWTSGGANSGSSSVTYDAEKARKLREQIDALDKKMNDKINRGESVLSEEEEYDRLSQELSELERANPDNPRYSDAELVRKIENGEASVSELDKTASNYKQLRDKIQMRLEEKQKNGETLTAQEQKDLAEIQAERKSEGLPDTITARPESSGGITTANATGGTTTTYPDGSVGNLNKTRENVDNILNAEKVGDGVRITFSLPINGVPFTLSDFARALCNQHGTHIGDGGIDANGDPLADPEEGDEVQGSVTDGETVSTYDAKDEIATPAIAYLMMHIMENTGSYPSPVQEAYWGLTNNGSIKVPLNDLARECKAYEDYRNSMRKYRYNKCFT